MTNPISNAPEAPRLTTSDLLFRLRPVATPKGFRYHVDARPASSKYAPVWQQVTLLPQPKALAQKFIDARSGR